LWKSIEQFLSDPANKLTNAEENATSSMEVKMQFNQLYMQLERYQSYHSAADAAIDVTATV